MFVSLLIFCFVLHVLSLSIRRFEVTLSSIIDYIFQLQQWANVNAAKRNATRTYMNKGVANYQKSEVVQYV